MQNYITGLEAGIYKKPQEETVKKYIQVFKANWKYAYNTPQENVDELNNLLLLKNYLNKWNDKANKLK